MHKFLATPTLYQSQVQLRIGLARNRLHSFPLDDFDFLFNNVERPDGVYCHAHQCTGDLIGRMLNALSLADGIDGKTDPLLGEMFSRMIRQRQKNGMLGVIADPKDQQNRFPNESTADQQFTGVIRYYELTGDHRALDVARSYADYILKNQDRITKDHFCPENGFSFSTWFTEPLSLLYRITHDKRYSDLMKRVYDHAGSENPHIYGAHSHASMTTLRGFQRMAIETGDLAFAELPEKCRKIIAEEHFETAAGDIPEIFPSKEKGIIWDRNETCSVADWLMLNLNAGQYLEGEESDKAYAKAEHILWNALFFNQLVTGGFGHQQIIPDGYGTDELQEAWWCCTETALLAMAEYSRHAVTYSKEEIRINFLLPGTYSLDGASVKITSLWPGKAEAKITVTDPKCRKIYIRRPDSVRNYTENKWEDNDNVNITVSGEIGHTVEPCGNGKYCMKYGILVMTFGNGTWNRTAGGIPSEIPEGYAEPSYPTTDFTLNLPSKNEYGFYDFSPYPRPEWASYEEGPNSRVAFKDACVHAEINFPDGSRDIYCRPLCHLVSSLFIYPRIITFRLKNPI